MQPTNEDNQQQPQAPQQPAMDGNFDLDLDTLSQSKKRVKIAGNIVEFDPPALEDLIELAKLGAQLQKFQGADTKDPEQMSDVMDKLKKGLTDIVPELSQYKLNFNQLLALIDLFVQSAQPNDTKELEKRGIKLDGDQKKTPSA
jgi:hypothetical protein